uniref:F-box domain-containing protein n=1 Tax=Palpitomonas bilix TaxID=652834 RepID=A0A7S3GLD4_9EUKA
MLLLRVRHIQGSMQGSTYTWRRGLLLPLPSSAPTENSRALLEQLYIALGEESSTAVGDDHSSADAASAERRGREKRGCEVEKSGREEAFPIFQLRAVRRQLGGSGVGEIEEEESRACHSLAEVREEEKGGNRYEREVGKKREKRGGKEGEEDRVKAEDVEEVEERKEIRAMCTNEKVGEKQQNEVEEEEGEKIERWIEEKGGLFELKLISEKRGEEGDKKARRPLSLLSLPPDVLRCILVHVNDPFATSRLMSTCRLLRRVSRGTKLWKSFFQSTQWKPIVAKYGQHKTWWRRYGSCMSVQQAWLKRPSVDHTIIPGGVLDIAVGTHVLITSGTNGALMIHERRHLDRGEEEEMRERRRAKEGWDEDASVDGGSEMSSRSSIDSCLAGGTLKAARLANGHLGPIFCLALSKNEETLYSGGYDRSVKIWDVATLTNKASFHAHSQWMSSMLLLEDQKQMWTSSFGGEVRVWTFRHDMNTTPSLSQSFNCAHGVSSILQRSSRTGMALLANHAGSVEEWDMSSAQRIFSVSLDEGGMINCLSYRRSISELVVAGGQSGIVAGFDPRQPVNVEGGGTLPLRIEGRQTALDCYLEENKLLVARADNRVQLFDIRNAAHPVRTMSVLSKPFCVKVSRQIQMRSSLVDSFHVIYEEEQDM